LQNPGVIQRAITASASDSSPLPRTIAARSRHISAGGITIAVSQRMSEATRSGACAAKDCATMPPIDRPPTCAAAMPSASMIASTSCAIASIV